jgi:hypothetical protein
VKYPDECPVFEWNGDHYEGRPCSWMAYGCITIIQWTTGPDNGPVVGSDELTPLTRAAREMLKWSCQ